MQKINQRLRNLILDDARACNPNVHHLDLQGMGLFSGDERITSNREDMAYLRQVGEALARNPYIEYLDLSVNNLETIDFLLPYLQHIKHLDLRCNGFGYALTPETALALAQHPTLRSIDLNQTGVTDAIGQIFAEHSQQTELEIFLGNKLRPETLTAIEQKLQENRAAQAEEIASVAELKEEEPLDGKAESSSLLPKLGVFSGTNTTNGAAEPKASLPLSPTGNAFHPTAKT